MNENENEVKEEQCNELCETYCRVCGYYRPVSNMNCGKQEEFEDRQNFDKH